MMETRDRRRAPWTASASGDNVRVPRASSTDSRALRAGDLFVALRGERFDGHDFVAAGAGARRRGGDGRARDRAATLPLRAGRRWPTRARALGQLAAHWRARFALPLVGAHRQQRQDHGEGDARRDPARALRRRRACSRRAGNLNNDIGVPLTLLRLRDAHRCARRSSSA